MRLFTRTRGRAHQPARRRALLALERLEDRQLLAATVYTVGNLYDGGPGSLANAVDQANHQATQAPNPDGSIIQFAPGLAGSTVHMSSTLDLTETDGPERIVGPAGSITLTTGGAATVLAVEHGTLAALTCMNITGGAASVPNALDTTPGNTTLCGGGIFTDGNLTLTNCIINNNTAAYAGGGIFAQRHGALTVIDSTISNNTSNAGGGIYNEDGTLVVINSTIDHNTATSTATDGYGVYNGGGIYNNGPYISGTKIGAMTLINTTIVGNTAPDAAGIYENGTTALITNCTITGNTATDANAYGYSGAGIGNWGGVDQNGNTITDNMVLNNTIVAGNFNSSSNVSADIFGPVVGSHNLVGTGSNLVDGVDGNQVGVTNLGLGSLAYNGGPTQTILPLSGSPVINTGSVALAVDAAGLPLTTDQRGMARTINGAVDIGATEVGGGTVVQRVALDITWASPADITYGTALSSTQLDATTRYNGTAVSGQFVYTPAVGTVLHAGQGQLLSARFIPDDQVDYTNTDALTTINVNPVALTITANDASKVAGTSNPQFTASGAGWVNGDTLASLRTPPTLSTAATDSSPVGQYAIIASGAADSDYIISYQPGTFTVTAAPAQTAPTLTVTDAGGVYNGSAYAATANVDSIEGVPVTLDYQQGTTDLGSTAPINAGSYEVTAYFAGSTDYTPASASTQFTITKATPTITVTDAGGTYNGAAHPATLSVTAIEGVPVTLRYWQDAAPMIDLGTQAPSNAGTYEVYANFAGSADYAPVYANELSDQVQFTIAKATATIVVTPYSVTYNGAAHTATSAVPGVNLTGTTHTNAGTYQDSWSFTDSTGNYNSTTGTVTDTIAKANAVITVAGYNVVYNGATHAATGAVHGVNGVVLAGLNLVSTVHVNAGTYHDVWSFTDSTGNYNSASGPVTNLIQKANAYIVVNGYIVLYNGAPHVATGAAYGVNGAQLAGLNLASTVHVAIGAYRDTWSFIDHTGNYNNANGTVADTIYGIKMVPTVVVTPTLKWFLTPEWARNWRGRWMWQRGWVPRIVQVPAIKMVPVYYT